MFLQLWKSIHIFAELRITLVDPRTFIFYIQRRHTTMSFHLFSWIHYKRFWESGFCSKWGGGGGRLGPIDIICLPRPGGPWAPLSLTIFLRVHKYGNGHFGCIFILISQNIRRLHGYCHLVGQGRSLYWLLAGRLSHVAGLYWLLADFCSLTLRNQLDSHGCHVTQTTSQ